MRISKREIAYLRNHYGDGASGVDRSIMNLLEGYEQRGAAIRRLHKERVKMQTERKWLRMHFTALKIAAKPVRDFISNIIINRTCNEISATEPKVIAGDEVLLFSSFCGQLQAPLTLDQCNAFAKASYDADPS